MRCIKFQSTVYTTNESLSDYCFKRRSIRHPTVLRIPYNMRYFIFWENIKISNTISGMHSKTPRFKYIRNKVYPFKRCIDYIISLIDIKNEGLLFELRNKR